MKPSCSPPRTGSKHVLLDLERSISKSDLRSGQVKSGQDQIMTQADKYAHTQKRLDKPSRVAPFAHLYLHPVATY